MLGYFQNFLQHLDLSALLDIIQQVLAVLLCLTVHETCHGPGGPHGQADAPPEL